MTATRLKYVITKETDLLDTVDPLGGSYFIEWLTSEFEERISHEIATIEQQGGALKCVENGYIKQMLIQDAYAWQKDFEAGKKIRVGNNYATTDEQEKPTRVYRTDPKVEQERIDAVQDVKRWRNNEKVKKCLDEIKRVAALHASEENNLMPYIMEAVKCYASNGEVAGVLKEVWGEYSPASIF